MKKAALISTILILFFLPGKGQDTTIIYSSLDATVNDLSASSNFGTQPLIEASRWTSMGTPFTSRLFVGFGLQAISGKILVDAYLVLHGLNHVNTTEKNEAYLDMVSASWTETGITWNNQPGVTSTDRISLDTTTSMTQNDTINVTSIVAQWHASTAATHGFRMALQDEINYHAMRSYHSRDNGDSTLIPILIIRTLEPSYTSLARRPTAQVDQTYAGVLHLSYQHRYPVETNKKIPYRIYNTSNTVVASVDEDGNATGNAPLINLQKGVVNQDFDFSSVSLTYGDHYWIEVDLNKGQTYRLNFTYH